MKVRSPFFLMICLAALCLASACNKDNLPEGLDWTIVNNPSRFPLMNDRVALVYEVKVKNTSIDSYSFESVNVKDGSATLLDL
jgi:archaellum component FlaG (FlaF/FlaG flagellin family)